MRHRRRRPCVGRTGGRRPAQRVRGRVGAGPARHALAPLRVHRQPCRAEVHLSRHGQGRRGGQVHGACHPNRCLQKQYGKFSKIIFHI